MSCTQNLAKYSLVDAEASYDSVVNYVKDALIDYGASEREVNCYLQAVSSFSYIGTLKASRNVISFLNKEEDNSLLYELLNDLKFIEEYY